jgi:hypothetical protein
LLFHIDIGHRQRRADQGGHEIAPTSSRRRFRHRIASSYEDRRDPGAAVRPGHGRNHGYKSCNISCSLMLLGAAGPLLKLFDMVVNKHLNHTQKFSSGIAETDIALACRGA